MTSWKESCHEFCEVHGRGPQGAYEAEPAQYANAGLLYDGRQLRANRQRSRRTVQYQDENAYSPSLYTNNERQAGYHPIIYEPQPEAVHYQYGNVYPPTRNYNQPQREELYNPSRNTTSDYPLPTNYSQFKGLSAPLSNYEHQHNGRYCDSNGIPQERLCELLGTLGYKHDNTNIKYAEGVVNPPIRQFGEAIFADDQRAARLYDLIQQGKVERYDPPKRKPKPKCK